MTNRKHNQAARKSHDRQSCNSRRYYTGRSKKQPLFCTP